MSKNHYDVIIIGTGAGGGTLAYKLAPSGKRILLLERGDYVPREKDNWSTRAVNLEAKYNTKETWSDGDGKPLHPHTNYYVGGNTKFTGLPCFVYEGKTSARLDTTEVSLQHGLSAMKSLSLNFSSTLRRETAGHFPRMREQMIFSIGKLP